MHMRQPLRNYLLKFHKLSYVFTLYIGHTSAYLGGNSASGSKLTVAVATVRQDPKTSTWFLSLGLTC